MEHISRRRLLTVGLVAGPAAVLLAACSDSGGSSRSSGPSAGPSSGGSSGTSGSSPSRPPTPACGDGGAEGTGTPEQTEGPFFSTGSPERTSLRDGVDGTPLVVSGTVLSTECRPLAGAKLDFWQADDGGEYDNDGYRLRGHQFADAQGRYRLETIVPGLYPGRTRHIHVKVQAEATPVLTTQLYFPGEPRNDGDDIFDAALLMSMDDTSGEQAGAFDFVLIGNPV
jgi:protocatechuate 3,4-dioxygenase beta subunit